VHHLVTVIALLSALASFAGPHRASTLGVTAVHAPGTAAASIAPGGSFRKPSDTIPPHP
jgi:hypothetical protein